MGMTQSHAPRRLENKRPSRFWNTKSLRNPTEMPCTQTQFQKTPTWSELLSIWTKISIKMMLQSINDQHGWWHYFIIIRCPILLVTLQPKVCIHMHREQICKLPVYLWFHILWDKISKHLTKSHEHSLISSFLHVKEHCLPAVNVVLASLHHLAMEKSGSEGIVERWKNIRQRKRRRERRRWRMSIR